MKIEFLENIDESSVEYTYAILLARHKGHWVFVRHRDRDTWELPAGHVEAGETIDEAAERELYEETGAIDYSIRPLVTYRGSMNGDEIFGRLFEVEINEFGDLPDSEIGEVRLFDEVPEDLTYPDIQPEFIRWYTGRSLPPQG